MPRPTALSKVSTASLQAEIERRVSKLTDLLKMREDLNRQIADLNVLAGQFGQSVAAPAPVVEEPKPLVKRRRRRKAKTAKVAIEPVLAKPVAMTTGKLGQYDQTAEQFLLGLFVGGKVLTSADLWKAWTTAGRKGTAAKTLGKLVAERKLARRKIRGKKGSNYSLSNSAGSQAETVAIKPVVKRAAKKPGQYAQTADQFVLGLLKGKTMTTQQLAAAWKKAGRGGTVDGQLSRLTKAGKLNRVSLGHKKGSNYRVA